MLQLGISNDEVCLGETRVPKDVSAEIKQKSPQKWTSFRQTNGHMVAVISASPKAVMMASMLRLVVLVDAHFAVLLSQHLIWEIKKGRKFQLRQNMFGKQRTGEC